MGDREPGTPVPGESPLEYHPRRTGVLTRGRDPARGPCQVGSLTGAVASQRVTEAREGLLWAVGNRPSECKSISRPDCETYRSSRWETRL